MTIIPEMTVKLIPNLLTVGKLVSESLKQEKFIFRDAETSLPAGQASSA